MLDRPVIAKFIQHDRRPEKLAQCRARRIADEAARATQLAGCAEALAKLSACSARPRECAADIVLELIAAAPGRPLERFRIDRNRSGFFSLTAADLKVRVGAGAPHDRRAFRPHWRGLRAIPGDLEPL